MAPVFQQSMGALQARYYENVYTQALDNAWLRASARKPSAYKRPWGKAAPSWLAGAAVVRMESDCLKKATES